MKVLHLSTFLHQLDTYEIGDSWGLFFSLFAFQIKLYIFNNWHQGGGDCPTYAIKLLFLLESHLSSPITQANNKYREKDCLV